MFLSGDEHTADIAASPFAKPFAWDVEAACGQVAVMDRGGGSPVQEETDTT
jgi:hypothetical protein